MLFSGFLKPLELLFRRKLWLSLLGIITFG